MEIIIQKYELTQGNKKYSFSTQTSNGKLRLSCQEINTGNPSVYIGEFTLSDLTKLSSLFLSISSISEAQTVFDDIITNQKVKVESQGEYIFLQMFIKKKDGNEEYFSLLLSKANQNNTGTNVMRASSMSYKQTYENPVKIQDDFTNEYSSLMVNHNGNNHILNDIQDYASAQYTQIPETIMGTDNLSYDINGNNYNYDYENIQSVKRKRKRVDKLTLSLRAQPRPQEVETSPVYQQNVVETTKTTEINTEILTDLENLKNENERLKMEIIKLKGEIEILKQENNNLKLMNDNMRNLLSNNNNANNKELALQKQEVEKYIKEVTLLKNELNEFENYKKMKENEINSYKIQIEELLKNQNKIKEFSNQKQNEIDELKSYIDELLRKQKLDEEAYRQSIEEQNLNNKEIEEEKVLSIQDTRLEVVKGDIIQNTDELELLTRKISKNNKKIVLNLLYKATIDSDKAEIFHQKCDSAESSLVLIKSGNGKRFGGYTSCNWKGNSIEKRDENAFVFSLDKMKIYENIPGEDAIGCYPKYGPIFLGCQIRIYDEFFTKGGTTFEKGLNYKTEEDFELSGGLKEYDVKEIEVYSVEVQ